MPVLFRIGLGQPFRLNPNAVLAVEVDAFHPSDNSESMSFGSELLLSNRLAVRAGYQNAFQTDSEVGLSTTRGRTTAGSATCRGSRSVSASDDPRLQEGLRHHAKTNPSDPGGPDALGLGECRDPDRSGAERGSTSGVQLLLDRGQSPEWNDPRS